MIVYIPVNRQDTGTLVLAVPSEQLVYVSHKRCLRKTRDGYNTDFAYNTDYMFKTEQAAWDYLMGKKIHDSFYFDRSEIWPHRYFGDKTYRERKREERMKRENDKRENK